MCTDTCVHTHTHTHVCTHAISPDLANLQVPDFKHINRPIECKLALHVFIIRTYTFPEWGESIYICIYKRIYSNIYLPLWLALKNLVDLKNMFKICFLIWINLIFFRYLATWSFNELFGI